MVVETGLDSSRSLSRLSRCSEDGVETGGESRDSAFGVDGLRRFEDCPPSRANNALTSDSSSRLLLFLLLTVLRISSSSLICTLFIVVGSI